MFSLFSNPITVSGVPVSNGSIVLTLVGGPATIMSTGAAAPSSYIFNLDASGNPPAIMQAWGNAELLPAGTQYTVVIWSGPNGTGSALQTYTGIVGPSAPYAGTLYPNLTVLPLMAISSINGVSVSGTPSANQVLVATGPTAAAWTGTATINVSAIKQGSATSSFAILDNLGVSHLFISSSSPYTNTFVQGNGSGVVFLGSAAKTSVADTNGNIVTAGSITLQTTSQTLPASIANDTLGGILFTTNAGKGWQIANSTGQLQGFAGTTILLQGATSGGVTLVVPAVAGSNTLTFPAATDQLVGRATSDPLTNKTFETTSNTFTINGTSVSTGVPRTALDATAKDWQFLGTATGSGVTVGPVTTTGTFQQFMVKYQIKGYSGGTPVGRFLCANGTPSTTALTNSFKVSEDLTAASSGAGATAIPGLPLAQTLSNTQRSGTIFIDGASGAVKVLDVFGNEQTPSVASTPTLFRGASFFSDLGTNLPLKQFQLTVYDTLTAVAASSNTFVTGTYLTVWGRNND